MILQTASKNKKAPNGPICFFDITPDGNNLGRFLKGATFYFISKSIIDYLNYEVVSQTSFANEIPTQFPRMTFWDINPFTTKEEYMETFMDENLIERHKIFIFQVH